MISKTTRADICPCLVLHLFGPNIKYHYHTSAVMPDCFSTPLMYLFTSTLMYCMCVMYMYTQPTKRVHHSPHSYYCDAIMHVR